MSGPPLHPVDLVDRLSRLYAYTLQWIDSWRGRTPKERLSLATSPHRMGRWIGQRAPTYPFIFSTWLEYPEVFEAVDNEALAAFIDSMPAGLGPTRIDEAIRTISRINYPGLHQHELQPRSWWQILELPGSAGRYSSLICQVYPELSMTRNCTVVCQNWQQRPEGVIERAAAGVYALLAGAGEGSKPRILDGLPDLEGEYDLIVGIDGVAQLDKERLSRMLTREGDLVLLDKEPAPSNVTRLR